MNYAVQIRDTARKQIRALPKDVQHSFGQNRKVGRATENVGVHKVGRSSKYRARVGDYRIIYEIHDKALLVVVILVANRKESYRGL